MIAELADATTGRGGCSLHDGYLHISGRVVGAMAGLAVGCLCPPGPATDGVGGKAEPLSKDDRRSHPGRGELREHID